MTRYSSEFDSVLEAATPTALTLAQQLLEEAGIPSLVHGPDFDLAELGAVGHAVLRRQDLFVPRGQGARALEILRAAWGEDFEA